MRTIAYESTRDPGMARARCTCGNVCDVSEIPPGGRFTCPACGKGLVRPQKKEPKDGPTQTSIAQPATDGTNKSPTTGLPDATAASVTPQVIGGYKITKKIRAGGMGVVYEAMQLSLQRKVALKVLSAKIAARPTALERFQRETEILVALRHPNIVSILDRGDIKGVPYYVMEYIDGPRGDGRPLSVEDLIRDGALSPDKSREIAHDIAEALKFAHSRGVIHRDIKPSNILIDQHGAARVLDFGISAFRDPSQKPHTDEHTGIGTADFMAPEQATDAVNCDERADVYSLGVLLYLMLTGVLPKGAFDPPSKKVPGLDPRWDPLVLCALRSDRKDRYPEMSSLLVDLDALGISPLAPVPGLPDAPTVLTAPQAPLDPAEARKSIASLRQALPIAETNYKTRLVALGEVILVRAAKAAEPDFTLDEPLEEAKGLRERMSRNEEATREVRSLSDRGTDLDQRLARFSNDLRDIETEAARQWLPLGERAWKLYQDHQTKVVRFEDVFRSAIKFSQDLDALNEKFRKIEADAEKAGFMGKMAAQARKLGCLAEINLKQMGKNGPLEEAGKKVLASDFGTVVVDGMFDRMLRIAKEREEGRARLAAMVQRLQADKQECDAGLRGLGVPNKPQQRIEDLGQETRALQGRLDDVHAQVAERFLDDEAVKKDPSLSGLLQAARQARVERERLRLRLRTLEAQSTETAGRK